MSLKLFLALLAVHFMSAAVLRTPAEQTPWELIEALRGTSSLKGFNGSWKTDTEIYYRDLGGQLSKYNAATDKSSIVVDYDFQTHYGMGLSFTFSPDTTKILIQYDMESVFRHSIIAKYDIFDIATKTSVKINNGKKLQQCSWSPVSNRLAFVYENDVYIHFKEGLEVRITSGGEPGVVYNGVPDWVYEEEVLSSGSAMWWSPDGTKLAVAQFNDRNVTSFKYHVYGDRNSVYQYPEELDLKYPKSGSTNPLVGLRVFDLAENPPSFVNLDAPVQIVSNDHILQNVAWSSNNQILITWLNRRQNIGSMQSCSFKGQCREVKRIEEPKGWIKIDTPFCLSNGRNCLFTYWIGNWEQVWNLDLETGENIWASRGNFSVLNLYGYDEANDKLYYQATTPGDPSNYQVFSNNDCLSCDLTDVDGAKCRSASASFSKNYSYYMMNCAGPNPSYSLIFETKTRSKVFTWESNALFRKDLSSKQRPKIEFRNVTLKDGFTGYAKLLLPPNLDQTKKYPLIVYVYGGPGSVRATSSFSLGFDAYLTTNRRVIVAIIDGRGTGNKGKDLLFSVNNNLGEHEVEDQMYVTKYFQDTLPYVDKDRTGIWGWSYGGYMTAKTIATDSDKIYQCGISVAPVTSWLYYDTIYTERYMGLPTVKDNLRKYMESSVLNGIENFRTHDFMLIHGSGDDNVHYQNSLLLAKLLQQNDVMFEQMTYVDENHSIGNFQPHLYNTMDHFWSNCLNLEFEDGRDL